MSYYVLVSCLEDMLYVVEYKVKGIAITSNYHP
jgi:hypothetical protein